MPKPLVAMLLLSLACGRVALPTEPNAVVTPRCSNPAPLINANSRAFPDRVVDEYIVLFRPGSDVNAESARLAAKYGFRVKEIFWITPSFGADLEPHAVAQLRCEPSVQTIEFSNTNIPPP